MTVLITVASSYLQSWIVDLGIKLPNCEVNQMNRQLNQTIMVCYPMSLSPNPASCANREILDPRDRMDIREIQ